MKGRIMRLRCEWHRPPYCKDDYCQIILPDGSREFIHTSFVEFDGDSAWVEVEDLSDPQCEVRLLNCGGHRTKVSLSDCRVEAPRSEVGYSDAPVPRQWIESTTGSR